MQEQSLSRTRPCFEQPARSPLEERPLAGDVASACHYATWGIAAGQGQSPSEDLRHFGNAPTTGERLNFGYRLKMSMKLIVPLNSACATSWERLTAS